MVEDVSLREVGVLIVIEVLNLERLNRRMASTSLLRVAGTRHIAVRPLQPAQALVFLVVLPTKTFGREFHTWTNHCTN